MYDLPKPVKVTVARTPPKTQYLEAQATGVHPWFALYYKRQIRGRDLPMPFNYYDKTNEFMGWALVSLIAGQHDKFDELSKKTDGWKKVDLKISINGVEVDTDHFMESVESNMKYWAGQKAAESVENVMDNVREKINKIDDMLNEVSDFVKRKLEDELGVKFPEH